MNSSSIAFAQSLYNIGYQYMSYVGVFYLIAGVIGNLLIIFVFNTLRVFKGNTSAFYLTVESFSNIGLILVVYISKLLKYAIGADPIIVSVAWCKLRSMLLQFLALCSLYSVCLLSFDQYLSTNLRHNWRQMSTLKLAHYCTCFNICFGLLHSITSFVFSDVKLSLGCTIYDPAAKLYYSFFFVPIIANILPVVVTMTFSLLAYRNVRRIIRRQLPVVRRRLDRQMTAITLARVVVLMVFGFPYILNSLLAYNVSTSPENYLPLAILSLALSTTTSLLHANFSISLYVFLAVSSRFRRQVRMFLTKRCWRRIILKFDKMRTNPHGNQVSPATRTVVQQSVSSNELE